MVTAARAACMADKPTTGRAPRGFRIPAVDGVAAREAVVHAPAIAAVGTNAKRFFRGRAAAVKAHPSEFRDVPNSAIACRIRVWKIWRKEQVKASTVRRTTTDRFSAARTDWLRFVAIIDVIAAAITTVHSFSINVGYSLCLRAKLVVGKRHKARRRDG